MKERDEHTINIISSQSGVNLYSTLNYVGENPKREDPRTYPSLAQAENSLKQELSSHISFDEMCGKLKLAEKAAMGLLFIRNISDQVNNSFEGTDIIPLLAVGVMYILTEFANDLNADVADSVSRKLSAVREAVLNGQPQYQTSFPLS